MSEEKFYSPATEVRAVATSDGSMKISGTAATYNTFSRDLGGFREKIRPGAFDRCIREAQNVRCLFNHDPSKILGCTSAKTLVLAPNARGLDFHCMLPNTTAGRDAYESIKRGDISQCSFSFNVHDAKNGQVWGADERGNPTRELLDLNVYDVSPVTFPAYENGTAVQARSKARVYALHIGRGTVVQHMSWDQSIADARSTCHRLGIRHWTDLDSEVGRQRTPEEIRRSKNLLAQLLS